MIQAQPGPGPRVLVVDDQPAIREALSFALTRDGCAISQAGSLREARLAAAQAELIVLDLVLPDGSGLDFLRELRLTSDVPVIVLTSRDDESDRVEGLTLGADDYVVKPFSPREVAARVRAVLRRVRTLPLDSAAGAATDASADAGSSARDARSLAPDEVRTLGPTEDPSLGPTLLPTPEPILGPVLGPILGPRGLRIEPRTRRAFVSEVQLSLSRTEFNLLATLMRAPGTVFERQHLLDAVWGQEVVVGERTVDVHIKALRRKLDDASDAGELIETVRGVGYRLREG